MIGEKLGPYEILESIGSGGMGEVWKAQDTRLGRTVAIKKVKEQHSERFKQEARSIAALNHPYICQLFDIGNDYLVLEYVEGKPLSSPLPEQEAVQLAIQIATALEAAHKKGIIHRDLKPANIMITDEGSVKLLDFGLAKLYEQDASVSTLPTEDMPQTQAGAILGTVAYMSPEQAQGKPADARSDIFSFGLVLYEMLSGKRAFSGDSNFAVMEAIVRKDPPPLQTSSSLEKIMKHCLEKKPSERYQTMSTLKTELEEVLEKMQSKASVETQPSIAVLPFVNMSGDKEQEYFSDGLAEEIINALTKIPGLKVIARTSAFAFKGKEQDITKIAEALRVNTILEGSVRKSGNRIRITAQLITAADGSHLWAERYDRDLTDIFVIQDEIAVAIANALKVKLLTKLAERRRYEPNQTAYEAYLKARHLWGKLDPESLARCKDYLEKAVDLDPDYALAYCGYADHLLALSSAGLVPAHTAMPLVRDRAGKALNIDPSLPEAHGMLGIVAAAYDYNWKEAERQFDLAMARAPISSRVHQWYGLFYLPVRGRIEEAIKQAELGVKGDPLNVTALTGLAWALFIAGRQADAEVEVCKILELVENQPWASQLLGKIYASQKKYVEALKIMEKVSPMIPIAVGTCASVLKLMGQVDRAEKLIQQLMPAENYGSPLGLFSYYLGCGEIDKAVDWCKETIEQRFPAVGILSIQLKSSPRWPELARLMNLPEETQL